MNVNVLRQYEKFRKAIVLDRVLRREISSVDDVAFQMHFDSLGCGNVFFLDAELTHMVYVHDVCPYPGFVLRGEVDDFLPSNAPHSVYVCEDEVEELGLVLPWRKTATVREIGVGGKKPETNTFWTLYGEVAKKLILFPGERDAQCQATDKQRRVIEMLAKRATGGTWSGGESAKEPVKNKGKVSSPMSSFAYYPWQMLSFDEWRAKAGSDEGYHSIRLARSKGDSGNQYRIVDKVLKASVKTFKTTTLKKMTEDDEVHLWTLKRLHAWNST
jgi:hypothetical protein